MSGDGHLFQQQGVADEAGQLRRHRHQHTHLAGRELPRLARLHHQHAFQRAALDERHAQKRAVRVFARLREVLEARMLEGVGDRHRRHPLAHQAGQSFVQAHAHLADRLGLESNRGAQDQFAALRNEKVHRTDGGAKTPLDETDDVRQRLARVVAVGDQLADLFEREQQRAFVCGAGLAHVRRPCPRFRK